MLRFKKKKKVKSKISMMEADYIIADKCFLNIVDF